MLDMDKGLIKFLEHSEEKKDVPVSEVKVDIDKHGTIEMSVTRIHVNDSFDVIKEVKNVYALSGSLLRTITENDTVPSLGNVRDTLNTGRQATGEDNDGNQYSYDVDTVITHKKDYQIFITINK